MQRKFVLPPLLERVFLLELLEYQTEGSDNAILCRTQGASKPCLDFPEDAPMEWQTIAALMGMGN